MKFNVEKLKAISRPMTQEEKTKLNYRSENADWLHLSATIALKIRKILRHKGMSQVELATLMGVTPAQVSKLLSGKVNFELKTIAKLQSVLNDSIVEISLSEKQSNAAEQLIKTQVVYVTQFVKSNPIVSRQTIGVQSYFTSYKVMG